MVARAYTVAFEGVEAHQVEVQCALTPGLPAFSIVGLPDKAVSEARRIACAAPRVNWLARLAYRLLCRLLCFNGDPASVM